MRFKTPLIALTTVGLMALAACGSSGDGDNKGGTKGDIDVSKLGDTGTGTDPNRKGPVTIEGATEGGTVNVVANTGLETMDPTESYYTNTASILSGLVVRSLTQYVYDADANQMILVPDLATDLGTPNDDFTEWTFTIREGVKYENGQEVTPEDIAFGIERSMDREAFPTGAAYSNDYFLNGDTYKGPYTGKGAKYDGVTISGQDITIKMASPFPDMPYWGAFPAMGPIPTGDASDPAKYRLHPLSTGPYMFDKYVPQKSLILVKNPNWDPNSDPGRTAYPEKYVFDFQTDNTKIDETILANTGEGQATLSYDDVLAENYLTFKNDHADQLVLGGQPCTFYWAPDYRKITDLKVRQAIGWAYPYKDVILSAGLIEGVNRIVGSNLMPPGLPGRTEYTTMGDHEPGATDAAKAKALLEEADAVGFEVNWLYAADDPNSVKGKDVVVKALKEAGFDPQPVASTIAEFPTTRADANAPINVRSGGWCSDWPSGGSWFPPLLRTTDIEGVGLAQNLAAFSEKDVDDQIAEISTLPIEDQPAAWDELDKYISDTYYPLIVTGYGGVAQTHGSKINGFNNDAVFGMPTWKDIWLAQ